MLRKKLNKHIVRIAVKRLLKDREFRLDVRKYIPLLRSPSELDDILEELGWCREEFESNGWEQDTWYWYSHEIYPFSLVMAYGGFYGDCYLYRGDCED